MAEANPSSIVRAFGHVQGGRLVFTPLEIEQPPGCDPARLGRIEPAVEHLDLPALEFEQGLQSPDPSVEMESIL